MIRRDDDMGHRKAPATLTAAWIALGLAGATGQVHAAAGTPVVSAEGEELGSVALASSCPPGAHAQLERGLALLHHMNYVRAEEIFQAAGEADPECALAWWGVAMTAVHPLWPDTIPAEKLVAGRALLERAAGAAHRNERESAWIEALAAYYRGERAERERLASFEEGWAAVHATFPEDAEAAAFHALSLLATADVSDKGYALQIAAGEILETVLERVPSHPGAHHYTIHAYDVPELAERALPVVRRYGDLAPENTHALHMTSHIYTRLGMWPESIEFNRRAAAASEDRVAGGHVSLHHFHAYDYLAYAHLQRADDEAAGEVLEAVRALEPPFQDHSATAYAIAAVPARMALERHDWERAAALELERPDAVAWDQYPYLEAIPAFARALGGARTGRPAEAEAAIAELARLQQAAAALDVAYDWGVQVAIQKRAAESWLAFESGDVESALAMAREAAQMEATTEKNPVTPGEVLPAAELYGDMLLAAERPGEALAAYRAALVRSPNRLNSLYGAARAAELAGDREAAEGFYRKLLEVCPEPTGEHPELERAREVVG